jgi:hypothetical protein
LKKGSSATTTWTPIYTRAMPPPPSNRLLHRDGRAHPAIRIKKQSEGFYERSQPHCAQDPIIVENRVALIPFDRLRTEDSYTHKNYLDNQRIVRIFRVAIINSETLLQ